MLSLSFRGKNKSPALGRAEAVVPAAPETFPFQAVSGAPKPDQRRACQRRLRPCGWRVGAGLPGASRAIAGRHTLPRIGLQSGYSRDGLPASTGLSWDSLSQPPSDPLGCKACWTPCILMQSLGAAVHTEEALCVSCGDHSQHPKGWRRKDGQGSPVPVGSCGVQSGLGCAILPPGTAAVRPLAEVALTSPSCPPPHLPSQGVLKKVKAEVPETVYT